MSNDVSPGGQIKLLEEKHEQNANFYHGLCKRHCFGDVTWSDRESDLGHLFICSFCNVKSFSITLFSFSTILTFTGNVLETLHSSLLRTWLSCFLIILRVVNNEPVTVSSATGQALLRSVRPLNAN